MPPILDAEDQDKLWGKSWNYSPGGYAMMYHKGEMQYVHRWIMGCTPGDGRFVDHINGIPNDNRRCNLRIIGQSLNVVRGRFKPGTSGHRGVYPQGSKWVARVHIKRIPKHLGTFFHKEDAARAVTEFNRIRFGDSL